MIHALIIIGCLVFGLVGGFVIGVGIASDRGKRDFGVDWPPQGG